MSRKMSAPQSGVEALLAQGKLRQQTTTKLPEGYAAGGVPGGLGGGMHIGRSSHPELRRLGATSPGMPKGVAGVGGKRPGGKGYC